MQETWVQSPVGEDATGCRPAKPVHHNTEPVLKSLRTETTEVCTPKVTAPQGETRAPQLQNGPCSPQLEKSPHSNEDPGQPNIHK